MLHDVDFECYPEEHCKKAPELLKEIDASEELIHAVCSHGYGICSEVEPKHEMEKILFATDELTGLIWAAAKMRPSKSTKDMEVSSLKKKFKDKKFAAGCSREIIIKFRTRRVNSLKTNSFFTTKSALKVIDSLKTNGDNDGMLALPSTIKTAAKSSPARLPFSGIAAA